MIRHVGLILDGNRRYAKKMNKPIYWGHKQGAEHFFKLGKHIFKSGVNELTAYVLSTENLKRSEEQVSDLLKLFDEYFDEFEKRDAQEKDESIKAQIHFAGNRTLFTKKLQNKMLHLEEKTANNPKRLNLCFGYGGQDEIVRAVQKLQVTNTPITSDSLSQALDVTDSPNLIIRTGGKVRTSNFLIWQSVYSEWFFPTEFWPELTTEKIDSIFAEYSKIDQNFGK